MTVADPFEEVNYNDWRDNLDKSKRIQKPNNLVGKLVSLRQSYRIDSIGYILLPYEQHLVDATAIFSFGWLLYGAIWIYENLA